MFHLSVDIFHLIDPENLQHCQYSWLVQLWNISDGDKWQYCSADDHHHQHNVELIHSIIFSGMFCSFISSLHFMIKYGYTQHTPPAWLHCKERMLTNQQQKLLRSKPPRTNLQFYYSIIATRTDGMENMVWDFIGSKKHKKKILKTRLETHADFMIQ